MGDKCLVWIQCKHMGPRPLDVISSGTLDLIMDLDRRPGPAAGQHCDIENLDTR